MSKINRFDGDVKAIAADSETGERFVFGSTTVVSDELTDQYNAAMLQGWGIIGAAEFPPLEWFNAQAFTATQFIAYLHQMGIPEWNATQEYPTAGALCIYNGSQWSRGASWVLGDEPGVSENWTNFDLSAVARGLNVANDTVELGVAGTVITAEMRYLYDPTQQLTYALPSAVGYGEVISSISGSDLVTNGGSYTLLEIDKTLLFKTLQIAIEATTAKNGDVAIIKERTSGNEGGATWDYITKGTTVGIDVADGYSIVDCNGNQDLVLSIRLGSWANGEGLIAFGASGGGVVDDTTIVNAYVNTFASAKLTVRLGSGTFLIDPSVSVLIDHSGTKIVGEGRLNTMFLAKYNTAGSVIKRTFLTGAANEYVQDVEISGVGVFLNHIQGLTEPVNLQIGFDMSNISRTSINKCYAGNFRYGIAESLYPNATDKTHEMWGRCYVYGNVSGGDIAYAGGEVHENSGCKAWWAKKGFAIDDLELTGGASASYATKISCADIQTVELGIAQQSQYNTGCVFSDNVIQDIKNSAGSTDDTFAYEIGGYDNEIRRGYHEVTNATKVIHLQSTANNNIMKLGYISGSSVTSDIILDDSGYASGNVLEYKDENDKIIKLEGGANFEDQRNLARVTWEWDGSQVNILRSVGVGSIVRNGVGDYTITWSTPFDVLSTINRCVNLSATSNASANPLVGYIRTQDSNTTRVVFINLNSSSNEDFPVMAAVMS